VAEGITLEMSELRHVLLVDDDPESIAAITAAARLHGCSVRTVAHGGAALDDIAHHMPALVICAMDLAMMGGLELLIRLRARYGKDAPPIVLTSRGSRPSGMRFRGVAAELPRHMVPEKLGALLDGWTESVPPPQRARSSA
jgi:CheY-like chemotaxis protein